MNNFYQDLIDSDVELDLTLDELDYDLAEMGLEDLMAEYDNPTVGDLLEELENM